ncbi:MAG: hypothetical protein M1549_01770 [Candidatus Dependentiae bacterium]|nr:hypothetical protein [Candidatus Dependentiae bacterium]
MLSAKRRLYIYIPLIAWGACATLRGSSNFTVDTNLCELVRLRERAKKYCCDFGCVLCSKEERGWTQLLKKYRASYAKTVRELHTTIEDTFAGMSLPPDRHNTQKVEKACDFLAGLADILYAAKPDVTVLKRTIRSIKCELRAAAKKYRDFRPTRAVKKALRVFLREARNMVKMRLESRHYRKRICCPKRPRSIY